MRRIARSLPLWLVVAMLPAGAFAAEPTPIEPAPIGEWQAQGEIRDTILPPGEVRARAAASRTERFVDVGNHIITVTTDLAGIDLMPYAQTISWLIHYDEIEDVTIEVVAPDRISAVCGAEALGCYQPLNSGRSRRGWIWVPSEHEDLLHIIVHEYGHHVDNQLRNLAHLDMGCSVSNDGSRNWFFAREADDSLLDSGMSCAPQTEWGHVLGELYAEDYTWLHGNRFWRPDLPVRAPGEWHLEALASDLAVPFERDVRRYSKWVGRGQSRYVSVKLDHWTYFSAQLTGRRAADLDLYLRKQNARRALERSRGDGSREQVERVLPPGSYQVEILAFAGSGRGTLRLALD